MRGSFAGGIMSGIQSVDQMFRAHRELGLREKESSQRELESQQRQYAFDRLKKKEEEQDAADKILSEEYAKLGTENATGVMKHAAMGQEFATPEAAQTAVKRADILPGDEEAVVAKDDPFKANPVVSTPVMAKTSEYDVHKNIGDRLAKANFGMRSQQSHQAAKKIQQEGALTVFVGLREGLLTLPQAEAIFNESGILRGVKFNAFNPETLMANITMPDGKTMDVNLQQQIGQYIDPKTYVSTLKELESAKALAAKPGLDEAKLQAQRDRDEMRNGYQNALLDLKERTLAMKGAGGGSSGSDSGSASPGGMKFSDMKPVADQANAAAKLFAGRISGKPGYADFSIKDDSGTITGYKISPELSAQSQAIAQALVARGVTPTANIIYDVLVSRAAKYGTQGQQKPAQSKPASGVPASGAKPSVQAQKSTQQNYMNKHQNWLDAKAKLDELVTASERMSPAQRKYYEENQIATQRAIVKSFE